MANVIIKSDERKNDEQRVIQSFGVNKNDSSAMEAAECIAARSREAYSELMKMEEKNR